MEIGAMRIALGVEGLDWHERIHFHFPLGKALEDTGDFAAAFRRYVKGNRLRRQSFCYDADEHHARLRRSHKLFTADFVKLGKAP